MSSPRLSGSPQTGLLTAAVATAVVVPQFGGNVWVATVALLCVWERPARNLWTASFINGGRNALALGTAAAFAGMTAFCLINEGFYQRHFWLVVVVADRLATLPVWEPTAPALAESPLSS